MHTYTTKEIEYIKSIATGNSREQITAMFNEHFGAELSLSQIIGAMKRNGITTGRDGRFQKGYATYNKGKRGLNKKNSGCFKAGNMPPNHRPVGSERVNVDGYIEIKVAEPRKWRRKHVVVWEDANGPVPKGFVVVFADSDKSNLNLDNLMLISRRQLGIMNKKNLIGEDADITRTGANIANVYLAIKDRRGSKGKSRTKRGI